MKAVIRKKELIKKVSLSDSTIWRLEKRGKFPARFNYVGRVAWDLDEIEAWLELQKKREQGRKQTGSQTLNFARRALFRSSW